ncbi:MAG TPA: hypothetical protein PLD25_29595 [Chloroflexota bacterium]|nr:hypothetical protein [Chloroflexota bacterium]HUM67279.1 hypothetical protein [Chloroflexota bacterium]
MILPTKHISTANSLIGVGAVLLKYLERPYTITSLWEQTREIPGIGSFERFTLALDLLYAIGSIDSYQGLLRRVEK